MRVWELNGGFGLDALRVVERPVPQPGKGELLLRMRAASLNYRDWLTVAGLYNPKMRLPVVPISDGVGVVEAVGEGVSRFKVGDRACPIFVQEWMGGAPTMLILRTTLGGPLDGVMSEYRLVQERSAVAPPAHMNDAEAATLPCAALTAWSALVTQGQIKAGDTVMVQGTGGVSLFALQIARLMGARVLISSSSDEKLARAMALGAEAGINYRSTPAWSAWARGQTEGLGVDHVIEVGGAGTLEESVKATRPGGTVSLIGVLSGVTAELTLTRVLMQNMRIQGVIVGAREGFEAMVRAFALHRLHPVLDQDFAFEQLPSALEHMAQGAHFGKVTLSF